MGNAPDMHALYGHPPARLADPPADARQVSPLVPGATALESLTSGTLAGATMLAPPGTLERRHDLALLLRSLAPAAPFTVLAPKALGGARLFAELAGFGCTCEDIAKSHHRICRGQRSPTLDEQALADALAAGATRRVEGLGLWSQPGIFHWDRIDPGTAALIDSLPPLAGRGADFGCGIGVLAHAVLASAKVTRLDLIDIDRRAIEVARRNVDDPRVRLQWKDVRAGSGLTDLDFVVMNPPFHAIGHEDKGLGQLFIRRAAEALRSGGRLWLVANRHLPYETALRPLFRRVDARDDANGFKVIEAQK